MNAGISPGFTAVLPFSRKGRGRVIKINSVGTGSDTAAEKE